MFARISFACGHLLLITAFLVVLATGGESRTTILISFAGVAIAGSIILTWFPITRSLGISIGLAPAIVTAVAMLPGTFAVLNGNVRLIPVVDMLLLIAALGYAGLVILQLRAGAGSGAPHLTEESAPGP